MSDEAVRDALEAVEVARRRLRHYVYPSADDSGQANALFEQYEAAIRASERERYAALVEAARTVDGSSWHSRMCPQRFGADRNCVCGVYKLHTALAALEEAESV